MINEINIDDISVKCYTDGYPISIIIRTSNDKLKITHLELDDLIYALQKTRCNIKAKLPKDYKHEVL
jgi:hypothetical protein